MGLFSRFENKMEDTVESAADKMVGAPLSPVQIAKKAEKQMRREKMVGAGKQYAPTLYTVLVNAGDDDRLFGYYPTLAGETETYLSAKAAEHGLVMDGQPLVRFIVDEGLKHGKFEIIAEMVAAPLVAQLRQEEMERYGISVPKLARNAGRPASAARAARAAQPAQAQVAPAYDDYDDQNGFDAYDDYYADEADGYENDYDDFDHEAEGNFDEGGQPQTMMFGAVNTSMPAPATPAAEEIYLYDITHDRAFTLTGEPMTIGREKNNDIVVPDINVSRQHAEIRQEANGAWVIEDLGSTNGTFVNGRRIKRAPLKDADMLVLGTSKLEFQIL